MRQKGYKADGPNRRHLPDSSPNFFLNRLPPSLMREGSKKDYPCYAVVVYESEERTHRERRCIVASFAVWITIREENVRSPSFTD